MRKLILFVLIALCMTMVQAVTINVLDNDSNHAVASAGSVNATYVSSLSGVNLANYDAIYIDEHSSSFLSGYETAIRNTMMTKSLGLVVEFTGATQLSQISTILGFSPAISTVADNYAGTIGAFALTAAGSSHMTFTGTGLEGGLAVNIANLNRINRSKAYYTNVPTGVEILATSGGNPLVITGVLGQSRYYLVNVELLEGSSNTDELRLAHNALFYVTQVPVPEPGTCILLVLAISGLFFYRRHC